MKNIVKFWSQKKILKHVGKSRNKYDHLYLGEKILLNNYFKNKFSVLDIGCSQGGLVSILKKLNNNFQYVGLDFNEEILSKAKKNYSYYKFIKINDNNFSKYTKKKFDLVVIFGILHLNKNWKNMINEAYKVTKKYLIFDMRETDKKILKKIRMQIKGDDLSIPYFIHHENNVKNFLKKNFQNKKIIKISYRGKPTKHSNYKKEIIFNNYCIYK